MEEINILTDVQETEILEKIRKKNESINILSEQMAPFRDEQDRDAGIESAQEYDDVDFAVMNSPEYVLMEEIQERDELKKQIFESNYWKGLREFQKKYQESLKQYQFDSIVPDGYADLATDVFGRDQQAETAAKILLNKKNVGAVNIGVIGSWGQGKTTFFRMVKKYLSDQKSCVVIDYDASEYEESEKIWANLARRMFETYEHDVCFPRTKYGMAKIRKDYRMILERVMLFIGILLGFIVYVALTKEISSIKEFVKWIVGTIIGCGSVYIFITQLLVPFIKKTYNEIWPSVGSTFKYIELPDYRIILGTKAEICKNLEVLLDAWTRKRSSGIIIFVDELDRCSEKGIVEFFQSVQMLLNNKHISFVFAIDPKCIRKAYVKQWGLKEEDNAVEKNLNEFLDKYFSVVIPLGRIEDYGSYIDSVINTNKQLKNTNCFSSDEIELIKKCFSLVEMSKFSPRKVKKVVNILMMTKEYCVKNGKAELPIKYSEFIVWYIFRTSYTDLAHVIVSKRSKQQIDFNPLSEVITGYELKKMTQEQKCIDFINMMRDYAFRDIVNYDYVAENYLQDVSGFMHYSLD